MVKSEVNFIFADRNITELYKDAEDKTIQYL